MKTTLFPQTTPNALHVSLFCICLRVLFAGLPLAVQGQANYPTPYTFTTLAGNAGYGSADGTNSAARFAYPIRVAVDSAGNLYVADTFNDTIRKVTPVGTNWVVTTLAGLPGYAGSADGTNGAARFNAPRGVAVDSAGNVYVADSANDTIRRVAPVGTNWVVTTLAGRTGIFGGADGTGTNALFNFPKGVAVDGAGNLYVGDTYNDTIRKLTPVGTEWAVTTIAGLASVPGSADGTNRTARFNYPIGMAVDSATNVYVADELNNTVRQLTPVGTNWAVTTLAGQAGISGTNDGSPGQFYYPCAVAVDTKGNVYVADSYNYTIREVTPAGVVTLAGQAGVLGFLDGTGTNALFSYPYGVAVDTAGNVYVADTGNNTIRKATLSGTNWAVTTLAGLASSSGSADGTGSAAQFNLPVGAALDSTGNLYVGDQNNHTIRQVTPAGVVTTLAGQAGVPGFLDGTGTNALLNYPDGVAVDSAGTLYVADSGNDAIRVLTPTGTNWVVSTLATGFNNPNGVAVDTNGNVYVGDSGNNQIEQVTPAGVVTALVTNLSFPFLMALDAAGNVYVADSGDNTIRKLTPTGTNWVVSTLAGCAACPPGSVDGTSTNARFNYPSGVALDTNGNVYVSDNGNYTIRKVTPAGKVTTLAGLAGTFGSADGTGSLARFYSPYGVAVDSAGNVYVADGINNNIRKGFPAVPAPRLQPPNLSAGQFGFGITGLPSLEVDIQSSGDLSHWQVVGTSILAGGTNYFVSPNSPQGAQFYRSQVR